MGTRRGSLTCSLPGKADSVWGCSFDAADLGVRKQVGPFTPLFEAEAPSRAFWSSAPEEATSAAGCFSFLRDPLASLATRVDCLQCLLTGLHSVLQKQLLFTCFLPLPLLLALVVAAVSAAAVVHVRRHLHWPVLPHLAEPVLTEVHLQHTKPRIRFNLRAQLQKPLSVLYPLWHRMPGHES